MPLTQQEIRNRALEFSREWATASRERAEAQTFWNEFFAIFGLSRRRLASYEEPVRKLGTRRGSIDLFWKGTLLVEHKSRGQDLDKAYGQALDYFPGIKDEDLPQYVLVSDFARFRLYDLEADVQHEFALADLPANTHLFGFISGYKKRIYKDEDPVNIEVAERMGALHDALRENGYVGHALEVFLVRLMYCMFADDTGIFPKDHFRYFLENRTREDGADTGQWLETIFQTLDIPSAERQRTLDEELAQFPYVNGSLFAEGLRITAFDARMRRLLLNCASFDWSKVSPAIFGSMFQAVMNPDERRNLGAHYTSERNILKVVRGLFLDELEAEFERVKNNLRSLRLFHERIAGLRFFDPACGAGNFLVITYREIRRLETRVLKALRTLSGDEQLVTDVRLLSRIDVDSVYGIELEEFPARIAETALWITDHMMNMELSAEFGLSFARLPLTRSPHIAHGNALRMNWTELVSKPPMTETRTTLYLLGNPPFVGKHNRSAEQTADMAVACREVASYAVLDYVCAWYVKAAEFMRGVRVEAAFVSTNSITQGEQVGVLWRYLFNQGINIRFAHRTFKWSNEARGQAQVFCVIIGFTPFNTTDKRLYDYETPTAEAKEIKVRNINPYLVDVEDTVVTNRDRPLCNVPSMLYGSKPTDGGHLLLTNAEKEDLLSEEPRAEKFIRPLISAHEFLNGENRWCLWFGNASPAELRALPEVMSRIQAVKEFRLKSTKAATRKLADSPYLFGELRQPQSDYVVVPLHSSEHRRYVPMGFFTNDNIVHNSCSALQNATLYHFGVLTSAMHMAWMRQVCGRLEGRYRYSNNIVYNNFPWAENPTEVQRSKVERLAQAVLDARTMFPSSTLADLYDPLTMPRPLLDAHRKLDAAVDLCYRPVLFTTELERLEFLFALYRKYTAPLVQAAERPAARRRRRTPVT